MNSTLAPSPEWWKELRECRAADIAWRRLDGANPKKDQTKGVELQQQKMDVDDTAADEVVLLLPLLMYTLIRDIVVEGSSRTSANDLKEFVDLAAPRCVMRMRDANC